MEIEHLYQVAERMRGVQIDQRDALDVIRACDAPKTLFYLDPPYMHCVRSKWTDVYSKEMAAGDHEELALLARSLEGMVIISGYPSGEYQLWYENHGWQRYEKQTRTNSSGLHSADRTEAIWLSPRTARALDRTELPLFAAANGDL